MARLLTPDELRAATAERAQWQLAEGALVRSVQAKTFADGISLVNDVAAAAEELNHHPDIDVRYTTVRFALSTHSAGGITAKDLQLADRIDALAKGRAS